MHYLAVVEDKQGGMFLQVHTRESQALWTGVKQGWRAFLSRIERFSGYTLERTANGYHTTKGYETLRGTFVPVRQLKLIKNAVDKR